MHACKALINELVVQALQHEHIFFYYTLYI